MFSPPGGKATARNVVADNDRLLTSPTHRSDALDVDDSFIRSSTESIASPSGLRHELETLVAAHHALGAQASDLGAELQQARIEAEALRAHLGSVGSESSMSSSASSGSATKSQSVVSVAPQSPPAPVASSPPTVQNYIVPNASPAQSGALQGPEIESLPETNGKDVQAPWITELKNQLKSAQEELVAVESRRCAEALTAYAEHQHLQSVINELQGKIEKQTAEISMHRAAAAKAIIAAENARAGHESQARAEKARADELQTMVLSLRDQVCRLQLEQQQDYNSSSDDDTDGNDTIARLQQALNEAEHRIIQLEKEKEDNHQSIQAVRRRPVIGTFLNVPTSRSRRLIEPSAWTVLPPLTPGSRRKEAMAPVPEYYAVPGDKKKRRLLMVGRLTRTSIVYAAAGLVGMVAVILGCHHQKNRRNNSPKNKRNPSKENDFVSFAVVSVSE